MSKELIIKKFNFQSGKILSSLIQKNQQLFLSYAERFHFKKNKQIFYEGGMPTGIFILKKGRAKIYKTGSDGKEQIFYIYKTGELLGYHALLCDEPYEDTCETLEPCEIWYINKKNFEKLLENIPNLQNLLIQNMSHEFGVLVNIITVLAQKSLRERFALYLVILHDRYYYPKIKRAAINLPREDLANMIGTTRESLGRLIKEFKENGWIKTDKRIITVLDLKALVKMANYE